MTDERARPLSLDLNVKLSLMMFLQYAIWGAWLPLLYTFLSGYRGFTGTQIGIMFSVGAVGSLIAPFIAGQIADRYFNTEKFLGLSHIVGGVLVWFLAYVESFWGFLAFSLAYSFVYPGTPSPGQSHAFRRRPGSGYLR
ncbi:MAG: MFS transporter, partial [Phycisphaerales bacterium]|nr:MFS transporter [Phycisphaerales bacterium]